jgi:hypothetical protein
LFVCLFVCFGGRGRRYCSARVFGAKEDAHVLTFNNHPRAFVLFTPPNKQQRSRARSSRAA